MLFKVKGPQCKLLCNGGGLVCLYVGGGRHSGTQANDNANRVKRGQANVGRGYCKFLLFCDFFLP